MKIPKELTQKLIAFIRQSKEPFDELSAKIRTFSKEIIGFSLIFKGEPTKEIIDNIRFPAKSEEENKLIEEMFQSFVEDVIENGLKTSSRNQEA